MEYNLKNIGFSQEITNIILVFLLEKRENSFYLYIKYIFIVYFYLK